MHRIIGKEMRLILQQINSQGEISQNSLKSRSVKVVISPISLGIYVSWFFSKKKTPRSKRESLRRDLLSTTSDNTTHRYLKRNIHEKVYVRNVDSIQKTRSSKYDTKDKAKNAITSCNTQFIRPQPENSHKGIKSSIQHKLVINAISIGNDVIALVSERKNQKKIPLENEI